MLSCTSEYAEKRIVVRRTAGGQKGARTMSTFTKIVLPVIIAAGTSGLMFTAALI
jgi:ABC-type spermidine/putrescine transport system permease subunit II